MKKLFITTATIIAFTTTFTFANCNPNGSSGKIWLENGEPMAYIVTTLTEDTTIEDVKKGCPSNITFTSIDENHVKVEGKAWDVVAAMATKDGVESEKLSNRIMDFLNKD